MIVATMNESYFIWQRYELVSKMQKKNSFLFCFFERKYLLAKRKITNKRAKSQRKIHFSLFFRAKDCKCKRKKGAERRLARKVEAKRIGMSPI